MTEPGTDPVQGLGDAEETGPAGGGGSAVGGVENGPDPMAARVEEKLGDGEQDGTGTAPGAPPDPEHGSSGGPDDAPAGQPS